MSPKTRASSRLPRFGDYPDGSDAALGVGSPMLAPETEYATREREERPARSAGGEELDVRLRELEARLEELVHGRGRAPSVDAPEVAAAAATATHPVEWRGDEVDEFGLDPAFEARLRPWVDLVYRSFFRVEVGGIERVPSSGRCLVVANHSGTLPLDGLMLRAALRLDHPARRDLRWLAEDFVYYLPFAGTWLTRAGGVRACPENAERLLGRGKVVAAFPEGIKGIAKPYRERYRLRRFGRGGFVRLALRTETPLLPCAIMGAEETAPLLGRIEFGARALGLPYFPITPTFPWFGPLGLIPAPTKWRVLFGEPLEYGAYGPEAANDDVLVGRLTERVRAGVQRMLDEARAMRKSVFFG